MTYDGEDMMMDRNIKLSVQEMLLSTRIDGEDMYDKYLFPRFARIKMRPLKGLMVPKGTFLGRVCSNKPISV